MTSLLHQLENESILLMYLADELSADDRADVEQMLQSDAVMQAELERLRSLHQETATALARLDLASRLPVAEHVAIRRATRMITQRQIERASAPPPEQPALRELRFPWWSYPLTTAAAVLIAFLVWWGNQPHEPYRPTARYADPVPSGASSLEDWRAEAMADDLLQTITPSDDELFQMALNRRIDQYVEVLTEDPFDLPAAGPERAEEGI